MTSTSRASPPLSSDTTDHETVHISDQPRVETTVVPRSLETTALATYMRYETVGVETDARTPTAVLELHQRQNRAHTSPVDAVYLRLEQKERELKRQQETIVLLRSQLQIAEQASKKQRFEFERDMVEAKIMDNGDAPDSQEGYESDGDSSVDSDMNLRQSEFLKERVAAAFDANDFPEAEKYIREGLRKLELKDKGEKIGWNTLLCQVLMLQRKFEETLESARELLNYFAGWEKKTSTAWGPSRDADRAEAHRAAAEALCRIGGTSNLKQARTHCKTSLKLIKNIDYEETQRVGETELQGMKNDVLETMASILDAEGEAIEASFYRSMTGGNRSRTKQDLSRLLGHTAHLMPTAVLETQTVDAKKLELDPVLVRRFGLTRKVINGEIQTYGRTESSLEEVGNAVTYILENTGLEDGIRLASSLFQDTSLLNLRSDDSNTVLHRAIKRGRFEVAAMLISRGANVNAVSATRRSPLHLAANFKATPDNVWSLTVLIMLLERGAEVNRQSGAPKQGTSGNRIEAGPIPEGCTALIIAVVINNINAARILLAYGADPNVQLPGSLATALHLAVALRKEDLVLLLLENGADSTIKNSDGRSAAEVAPATSRRLDGTTIVWRDIFRTAKNGTSEGETSKGRFPVKAQPGLAITSSAAMDYRLPSKSPPPYVPHHAGPISPTFALDPWVVRTRAASFGTEWPLTQQQQVPSPTSRNKEKSHEPRSGMRMFKKILPDLLDQPPKK